MKYLNILVTALALVSCNKMTDDRAVGETSGECCLTVNLDGTFTKAVGQTTAAEDAINNVSIFVFRTDTGSKLDADSYQTISPANTHAGTTPLSLTLKCTVGSRRIYVLANTAKDFTETVKCEADLLAQSTLLTENGLTNFFMMGSKTVAITGTECRVDIELSRLVSSVRLEKITNLMEAKAYRADGLFTVDKIYLTNVVGKAGFDRSAFSPASLSSEYWLAKLNAENNPLIYEGSVGAAVNYGESKANSVAHTFYAFPNDCALSESKIWSQRSTMLVIEATLDGVKYYYPVAVGPLEANKQYIITNFTVRRPGSDNPWDCVHKADATIDIKVAPWGTTVTTTEDL